MLAFLMVATDIVRQTYDTNRPVAIAVSVGTVGLLVLGCLAAALVP